MWRSIYNLHFKVVGQIQVVGKSSGMEVSVDSMISGVRRIFQWGGSVTSHRDDVKILHYNYGSLEVLKWIVL